MNAVPVDAVALPAPRFHPMTPAWLDRVLAIESQAYAHAWSRGHFVDSLAAGYHAWLLLDATSDTLFGYAVAMPGVEEMHLLNLAVAPAHQRRGHALRLLDWLVQLCRHTGAERLWLEVRQSNERAQAIYRRYGFGAVGVRRGYYPAAQGREDAQVMALDIPRGGHALD